MQITYLERLLALLIGGFILFRGRYILAREQEPRRRYLVWIIILATVHYSLFYLFTLFNALYPVLSLPVIGLLATPAGQAMWGGGNGMIIAFTLYLLTDAHAQILKLRLGNGTETH